MKALGLTKEGRGRNAERKALWIFHFKWFLRLRNVYARCGRKKTCPDLTIKRARDPYSNWAVRFQGLRPRRRDLGAQTLLNLGTSAFHPEEERTGALLQSRVWGQALRMRRHRLPEASSNPDLAASERVWNFPISPFNPLAALSRAGM